MGDTEDIFLGVLGFAALGGAGFLTYKNAMDKKEGIALISQAAKSVSIETGIPLSIIATQAAHESNFGRSGLALKSHNLFGIKAGTSWAGKFDVWPTYEIINGEEIKVQAKFRSYDSWEESVRDWAKFIKMRFPNAYLAAVAEDSNKFFKELQKGGYATDPNYAAKLVAVKQSIEAII